MNTNRALSILTQVENGLPELTVRDEPVVEVPVTLAVVLGEQEVSLDEAIDRLAAIQDAERALRKEKDPLRKALNKAMRDASVEVHATPEGHTATTYEQDRAGHVVGPCHIESVRVV